jgi:hypothetical protein
MLAGETTSQCVGVEPFVPSSFSTGERSSCTFYSGMCEGDQLSLASKSCASSTQVDYQSVVCSG